MCNSQRHRRKYHDLSFVTVTNQDEAETDSLRVGVTGQGTVAPDYNNASLEVGRSYSIYRPA